MKSLLIAGVVVSAVAVAGMWMGRVYAQTSSTPVLYPFGPQVLTLGMVGVAPGQIARLNALNLLGCCSLADRPTQILSVPCNMTLSFMDDQGATLKTATMNIDSGKAVHLDLAHDDVTRDSSRLQIRGIILPVVTPPGPPVTPGVPIPFPFGCSVAPTLEIFDSATGITTTVLESAKGVPTILPLGAPTQP